MLEPVSAVIGREAGFSLDRSPVCHSNYKSVCYTKQSEVRYFSRQKLSSAHCAGSSMTNAYIIRLSQCRPVT